MVSVLFLLANVPGATRQDQAPGASAQTPLPSHWVLDGPDLEPELLQNQVRDHPRKGLERRLVWKSEQQVGWYQGEAGPSSRSGCAVLPCPPPRSQICSTGTLEGQPWWKGDEDLQIVILEVLRSARGWNSNWGTVHELGPLWRRGMKTMFLQVCVLAGTGDND